MSFSWSFSTTNNNNNNNNAENGNNESTKTEEMENEPKHLKTSEKTEKINLTLDMIDKPSLDESDDDDVDGKTMLEQAEVAPTLLEARKREHNPEQQDVDEMIDENKVMKLKPLGVTEFEQMGMEDMHERAKWIPIRLDLKERMRLRLCESALHVSEYTDKVDIVKWGSDKTKRIHMQLRIICSILSGLLVASDYSKGLELLEKKNFKDNADFFQDIFEIARRHKIMNPEKMRAEYGKLLHLLQDAGHEEIRDLLQFDCRRKVKTVYDFLNDRKAEKMLQDPRILTATMEIIDDGKKTRPEIQKLIKEKERAVEELAHKYRSDQVSDEEIKVCLRSIGDNNSFLRFSSYPIEKMILLLKQNFDEKTWEKGFSLSIQFGVGTARLTHDHQRQYNYVLQSLTLWKEIQKHMFRLWILGEQDLLDDENRYKLLNTGQGLNRVQRCPRVSHAIHSILYQTQQKLGSWVGSSVVHLGDHNVPNAFFFITKYNSVPNIINPIIITIDALDRLCQDQGINEYVNKNFGGKETAKKIILADFFRYGFDGSGSDNFFDSGSCIDGRLTSAWNWCNLLDKKPFYPLFKLAGFNSFEGEYK